MAHSGKLYQKYFISFTVHPPHKHLPILVEADKEAELDHAFKLKFADINNELNRAKDKMDPFYKKYGEQQLGKVLDYLDLYKNLKFILRKRFEIPLISNAWLKMYEILTKYKFIENVTNDEVVTFHNAELPGSFIAATNHYVLTNTDKSLQWLASSYVDDKTALEDQYGLYEKNKNRWLMVYPTPTPGDNGDLTDPEIIKLLKTRVLSRFKNGVDLYTSDAGASIFGRYDYQEELNVKIHFGQAISALTVLKMGGSVVLKHYTLNMDFNISLIVFLSQFFKTVEITKPITSRPNNSEIYIICSKFKGIDDEVIEKLLYRLKEGDFSYPLIDINKPKTTLLSIYNACFYIHQKQQIAFLNESMRFITRNIDNPQKLFTMFKKTRDKVIYKWLSTNKIGSLSHSLCLSSN
nr:putative methyltransferase [Abalone asfa-like virus]